MNELIPISVNKNNEQAVNGRTLHEFLDVKTPYRIWFPRMCEYGFIGDEDYLLVEQKSTTNNPKNPETIFIDHILTLNMAKEICMIQRSEKGKQARKYFIEIEKAWNDPDAIIKRAAQIDVQPVVISKIKVKQAAMLLGKSEQWLRVQLQRFPGELGYAVKTTGDKYSYHISPKKLYEYSGIDVSKIDETVILIKAKTQQLPSYKSFSETLKQAMVERNINQKELSILSGIGKSSISQYLSGKNVPNMKAMKALADALDIPINHLDRR